MLLMLVLSLLVGDMVTLLHFPDLQRHPARLRRLRRGEGRRGRGEGRRQVQEGEQLLVFHYPRAGVRYQEAADARQGLAVPGLERRAAPVFLSQKGLCGVGVHVDDQGLAGC